MNNSILVTGAAGFIGFHVARRLLQDGYHVIGVDHLNEYYEIQLKLDRLVELKKHDNFEFLRLDIANQDGMEALFSAHSFAYVIHLAAQAGVRYSVENPHPYVSSNLVGFVNVLEGCRHTRVPHLVFASSSSVYGASTNMPYSIHDSTDHPVSLYAATKKANELMAHSYAHIHGVPVTGLRFFTVYGPWGRPDMAYFIFTRAIIEGRPIKVFGKGRMKRDFTYIDDAVEGVVRAMKRIPDSVPRIVKKQLDPATSSAPYQLYNIGNNHPVELMHFIQSIEQSIGREAIKEYLPMQPGDLEATYASINQAAADLGFTPKTSIEEGIQAFVAWYRSYYEVYSTSSS